MAVKAKCVSDIKGSVNLLEDALYQAIICKRGKGDIGDNNDATLKSMSSCYYDSQDIFTKRLDWNQKIQVLIPLNPHIYQAASHQITISVILIKFHYNSLTSSYLLS